MHLFMVKLLLNISLYMPDFLAKKIFSIFQVPAELPGKKTHAYKTVNGVQINADVYVGPRNGPTKQPIMLNIHGGGWIGGNKSDYNRPMFYEFLQKGFVVVTMDYRLLPESSFADLLEDVRDIEAWIKDGPLQAILKSDDVEIDTETVVVCGGSAGGHLALLTPKLWKLPPVSIFAMYAPTNLINLKFCNRGLLALITVPPLSIDVVKALYVPGVPTGLPVPSSAKDFFKPRGLLGMNLFRAELIAEFLLRRLPDGELPQKGSVPRDEIESISPFFLCAKITYPPVYHIMGSMDELFDTATQVDEFDVEMKNHDRISKAVVVPGKTHAFDMRSSIGSQMHLEVTKPGVDWVCQFAKGISSSESSQRHLEPTSNKV